jgi:F-type H+-transporting ATPase subunit a
MAEAAAPHHHEIWIAKLFNDHLAGVANAALNLVGLKAQDRPWDNFQPMLILTALVVVALVLILRSRLSVDKPSGIQHFFELIYGFLKDTTEEIGVHHGKQYVPFFGTLFVTILVANLIGIIPGFESPTMDWAMPLGCAVAAFCYYNIVGIKTQGPVNYVKHFMGPIWWLAPLMLPIEIVSHLARPMSLTIRLRANMFAGEQVTLAFLDLTKVIAPVIFMGLHVFVSFLQAYIFTLMTMIYVSSAVEHEH